jgi:hypothetical protein
LGRSWRKTPCCLPSGKYLRFHSSAKINKWKTRSRVCCETWTQPMHVTLSWPSLDATTITRAPPCVSSRKRGSRVFVPFFTAK